MKNLFKAIMYEARKLELQKQNGLEKMTLIYTQFLNDSDEIHIMLSDTHTNYIQAFD